MASHEKSVATVSLPDFSKSESSMTELAMITAIRSGISDNMPKSIPVKIDRSFSLKESGGLICVAATGVAPSHFLAMTANRLFPGRANLKNGRKPGQIEDLFDVIVERRQDYLPLGLRQPLGGHQKNAQA